MSKLTFSFFCMYRALVNTQAFFALKSLEHGWINELTKKMLHDIHFMSHIQLGRKSFFSLCSCQRLEAHSSDQFLVDCTGTFFYFIFYIKPTQAYGRFALISLMDFLLIQTLFIVIDRLSSTSIFLSLFLFYMECIKGCRPFCGCGKVLFFSTFCRQHQ